MAAGFPRTFPLRLLPPATFVQGTTPLTSRRPRLLLLLLTSPPPIFVAVVVIATTDALHCVAMMTSSSATPTFLSSGVEGKEKTLRRMTYGIHSPLPIVLPPCVLFPHYSAGDYVLTGVVSQTERLNPPPRCCTFGGWSEVEGVICGGNIMRRMVHTSVIHVFSLCYTHRFCVKTHRFSNLADSESFTHL